MNRLRYAFVAELVSISVVGLIGWRGADLPTIWFGTTGIEDALLVTELVVRHEKVAKEASLLGGSQVRRWWHRSQTSKS